MNQSDCKKCAAWARYQGEIDVVCTCHEKKTSQQAFEDWINGASLVKKYGAKLTMNSKGDMYKDLRVNHRWMAWHAAVKFMSGVNERN